MPWSEQTRQQVWGGASQPASSLPGGREGPKCQLSKARKARQWRETIRTDVSPGACCAQNNSLTPSSGQLFSVAVVCRR